MCAFISDAVVSIGRLTAFYVFLVQWNIFRVNLPFVLMSSFRFVLAKRVHISMVLQNLNAKKWNLFAKLSLMIFGLEIYNPV